MTISTRIKDAAKRYWNAFKSSLKEGTKDCEVKQPEHKIAIRGKPTSVSQLSFLTALYMVEINKERTTRICKKKPKVNPLFTRKNKPYAMVQNSRVSVIRFDDYKPTPAQVFSPEIA